MKKGSLILLFLTLSLTGFAQQEAEAVASIQTEFIATPKTIKPDASKSSISAAVKAEVLKMNRKKSNEIISIKAYRKSLQIKVKTVKLC